MHHTEHTILTEEIETLLHILQGKDVLEEMTPMVWEAVAAASARHSIAPLLHLALRQSDGVPIPIARRLEVYYQANLKKNILHLHRLGHLIRALNAETIPVVVLKGCHLAETVYKNTGARVFGDADLLVKPEDMDRAHRCLTKAGAFSETSSLNVDLHWYLDNTLTLDMEQIWSRIQPATIGGVSTHVLSPEDLLIHICIHMGYHHSYEFGGLKGLLDIREIVRRHGTGLDWEYIAVQASKGSFSRAIHLPFHLAKMLISAKIPEDVFTALCSDQIPAEPVQWALSQMFSPDSAKDAPVLSPYFWSLWASAQLRTKLISLRKLIWPERNFIAQSYPSPPRSMKTYFYYMARIKDHTSTYLTAFARILLNKPDMKRILEKKRRGIYMKAWMTQEGETQYGMGKDIQ